LRIGLLAALVFALTPSLHAQPITPREDLSAPPLVTAKGWAIVDGKTGKLLWGHAADTGFKSASTTKIMCALVVLELAARDAKTLDETVMFSKFADDTPGSTADIRVGESLKVRECLYGLLLPSGNDAGNALAEHFNARFATPEKASTDTRANFVAEMNRTARRLGMTNTVYRIPYGDGGADTDRTTSPRDLLTLARAAMQNPLFREYVRTRRHESSVRQLDGQPRAVVWENTNVLLGIEGYDGVKTGTTTLAGSCLVASGRRGEDHLFVVVLGSESNSGRYVDARNLFRWAWLKLGHKPEEK
jgi:D-alanyl-D-alanine carboxypeptidase (penicillin-binding protein 5/6)